MFNVIVPVFAGDGGHDYSGRVAAGPMSVRIIGWGAVVSFFAGIRGSGGGHPGSENPDSILNIRTLSGTVMIGERKRTASEWEELGNLSKDELIIELVKERYIRRQIDRSIRIVLDVDYPAEHPIPVFTEDMGDDGRYAAPDDWAYRIASYAYEHCNDKSEFTPYSAMDYGLDEERSIEAYRMLRVNGIVTDDSKDLRGWFRIAGW